MSKATSGGSETPVTPILGYQQQQQQQWKLNIVNEMKQIEERILRKLDDLALLYSTDERWLAIGRTDIEKAFMAINRSILQPQRVRLPGDDEDRV